MVYGGIREGVLSDGGRLPGRMELARVLGVLAAGRAVFLRLSILLCLIIGWRAVWWDKSGTYTIRLSDGG